MGRSRDFIESFNEAEMSSKSNPKLHKKVMDKIAKKKYDSDAEYHLGLVKAMNPKKLSRSDLDTLNDFNDMYEELTEALDMSNAKSLLKDFQDGNGKVEKKLKSELKKAHSEIMKDFDGAVKAFMKAEEKRLKSQYPDFNLRLSPVSKRQMKDVSGNADSRLGDWYDSLDHRLSITHKF